MNGPQLFNSTGGPADVSIINLLLFRQVGNGEGPLWSLAHIEHKSQLTLKYTTPLKNRDSWKSVLDQFQASTSRYKESYGYHANQHEKLILPPKECE